VNVLIGDCFFVVLANLLSNATLMTLKQFVEGMREQNLHPAQEERDTTEGD